MVLLPPLGLTLNAWFVTNGLWAKNCTHKQVVCSEYVVSDRVIMGVISIVACCHIVSFVCLFGLSDSSSCILLNCKLVGQPFTKRQKSKVFSMQ